MCMNPCVNIVRNPICRIFLQMYVNLNRASKCTDMVAAKSMAKHVYNKALALSGVSVDKTCAHRHGKDLWTQGEQVWTLPKVL